MKGICLTVSGLHFSCSGPESQQGLSLLATLSAFYPTVDVLHSGFMSKRRERTVHGYCTIECLLCVLLLITYVYHKIDQRASCPIGNGIILSS
jgi:hypothetical protein